MPLDQPQEIRMSFGEHLEELRKRLLYAAVGSLAFLVVCTVYASSIIAFLVAPYRFALSHAGLPDSLTYSDTPGLIIAFLSVGFKAGLLLASPWIIYQLWQFVGAGLLPKERKLIYRYIGPSIALFLLGVLFFWFLVLPLTLKFLTTLATEPISYHPTPSLVERIIWNIPETPAPATAPAADMVFPKIPIVALDPTVFPADGNAQLWYNSAENKLKVHVGTTTLDLLATRDNTLFLALPDLKAYLSFITFMALLFGLSFEMPMVVMILAQINLVSVLAFGKFRKYAYFIFLLAAVITAPTPDLLTIFALWLPLSALYELGIVLARMVTRGRSLGETN